jgi:hypothetical protein
VGVQTAHHERRFQANLFVSGKRTAHDERFGLVRHFSPFGGFGGFSRMNARLFWLALLRVKELRVFSRAFCSIVAVTFNCDKNTLRVHFIYPFLLLIRKQTASLHQ